MRACLKPGPPPPPAPRQEGASPSHAEAAPAQWEGKSAGSKEGPTSKAGKVVSPPSSPQGSQDKGTAKAVGNIYKATRWTLVREKDPNEGKDQRAATPQLAPEPPGQLPSAQPPQRPPQTLRVLYLFAGRARWGDIRHHLHKLARQCGARLHMEEFDIERADDHDLSAGPLWEEIMEKLRAGGHDVLVLAPPCEDFTRVKYSLSEGPPPSRSKEHPRGFPGLQGEARRKAASANLLVDRSLEAAEAAHEAGAAFLLEHPEDLGRAPGGFPASIWQWPSTKELASKTEAQTVATQQQHFKGARHVKPTRFFGTLLGMAELGDEGWPYFDTEGYYQGPVPPPPLDYKTKYVPLVGIDPMTGTFRTRPSGAYPEGLCELIAKVIFDHWLASVELEPLSPKGRGIAGVEHDPPPKRVRLLPAKKARTEDP